MGPNEYPDETYELGLAYQDLDTRLTLACGCHAWQDSPFHDEDDCLEAQADWAAECEERYRAATMPQDGIAAARMWEAAQEVR
jgi:hypothetical protein